MNQMNQPLPRRRSDRKGSALIWAMLVIMVLTVLVTAALTFGLAYVNRSLANNAQKQAYFTARSAVDLLVEQCNNETARASLLPSAVGETVTVEDMGFEERMGKCSATIERIEVDGDAPDEAGIPQKEQRLVVTATADVRGERYTMHAVAGIVEGEITPPTDPDPDPVDPEPTPPTEFDIGIYTQSNAWSGNTVAPPFQLLGGTNYFFDSTLPDPLSISSDINGKNSKFEGDVLSRSQVSISGSSYDPFTNTVITGWVISDSDVSIQSAVEIQKGIYSRGTVTINNGGEYAGIISTVKKDVIADQVINTGKAVIGGGIKANRVTLAGGTTVAGDIFTSDGLVYDIDGKSYTEWNGRKIKKIAEQPFEPVSVLPREVQLPDLTTPEGTEEYYGGQIDSSSGSRNFTIPFSLSFDNMKPLLVSGKNPVVFYIGSNVEVSINQIFSLGETQTPVYFILQKGAELNLAYDSYSDLQCKVFVIGEDATFHLGDVNNGTYRTALTGSILVRNTKLHMYPNITINYEKPIDRFSPTMIPPKATLLQTAAVAGESRLPAAQTDAYQMGAYVGDTLGAGGDSVLSNALTVGSDTDFYYHGTKALKIGEDWGSNALTFSRNILSSSSAPLTITGKRTEVGGSVLAEGDVLVSGSARISGGIHTTGTVTLSDNAMVEQGIVAKNVVISDQAVVSGDISTIGNQITYRGREIHTPPAGSGFTMTEAKQITSQVPAYQMKVPNLPDDAVKLSRLSTNTKLGHSDGTASYYRVTSSVYLGDNNMKVQGSGDIYIFIDGSDARLNIGGINLTGDQKEAPSVYFILLNGGNFNIGTVSGVKKADTDIHILATGQAGEIYLGKDLELNGSIIVENTAKLQINQNVTINYKASEFDPVIPDGGGDTPPEIVWKILQYGRGEYDG